MREFQLPEVVRSSALEKPSPSLRTQWEDRLRHSGAILFRGLGVRTAAQFDSWASALSDSSMEYRETAAPRKSVYRSVYTSTDHPPPQEIFLHNESSYAWRWPSRLFLCCLREPESGGETPLSDTRAVFDAIPADVRERFLEKQILYVRNYGPGAFGFRWQAAFGTEDRKEVEAYCDQARIEYEWLPDDRLRTRQVRSAAAQHPVTGEWIWFNHAAVFHISTLGPRRAATLLRLFHPEDLPNNTYLGDGSEIDPLDLEAIREAYRSHSTMFRWQAGDVLWIDNLLVAHGRRPFRGKRQVLALLADPRTWGDLER